MAVLRNQAGTTTFAAIEALSCSNTGDVSYLLAGLVWPALFGRPTCSDSQYTALFLCTVFFYALTTGQQLNTFNHQAKIFVGGKLDSSGKLVRTFRGSLAGRVLFVFCV